LPWREPLIESSEHGCNSEALKPDTRNNDRGDRFPPSVATTFSERLHTVSPFRIML
jgi:hypothetical protein